MCIDCSGVVTVCGNNKETVTLLVVSVKRCASQLSMFWCCNCSGVKKAIILWTAYYKCVICKDMAKKEEKKIKW